MEDKILDLLNERMKQLKSKPYSHENGVRIAEVALMLIKIKITIAHENRV